MGEMCDFENEHPQFMRSMGIDPCFKNGKKRTPNFHMTITPALKKKVQEIGGVVAVRHLIINALEKCEWTAQDGYGEWRFHSACKAHVSYGDTEDPKNYMAFCYGCGKEIKFVRGDDK